MSRRKQNKGSIYAKRSLGQNFLIDGNYISKITNQLNDIGESLVIELGPGRGALTEELARRAGQFIAIELDTLLAAELNEKFIDNGSVIIIEADILETDFRSIVAQNAGFENAFLIANLPYNISTPFLQRLTEISDLFAGSVFMLQKEVVTRITAKPGTSDRGFLTVFLEAFFIVEKLFDVPPTVFRPVPKVWSSVLRLIPRQDLGIENPVLFRKLVSSGFRQKRKTILNNLKASGAECDWRIALSEAGVDPKMRPETLDIGQWVMLSNILNRLQVKGL